MNSNSRFHLLIGSTIGASLVVGAVSVVLYYIFFPPYFRGWGELTPDGAVAGWVVNQAEPSARVEVQLFIDGRFVASRIAELPRPDVVAAGWTRDDRCGYEFPLPALSPGEHESRVYAVHIVKGGAYRTLQLSGNPLRFRIDDKGRVNALE